MPGRLPRGGVDRNIQGVRQLVSPARRLPRGGVDRNYACDRFGDPTQRVASRAEAWIETWRSRRIVQGGNVASRAEAWIETVQEDDRRAGLAVASRAEAWIET